MGSYWQHLPNIKIISYFTVPVSLYYNPNHNTRQGNAIIKTVKLNSFLRILQICGGKKAPSIETIVWTKVGVYLLQHNTLIILFPWKSDNLRSGHTSYLPDLFVTCDMTLTHDIP